MGVGAGRSGGRVPYRPAGRLDRVRLRCAAASGLRSCGVGGLRPHPASRLAQGRGQTNGAGRPDAGAGIGHACAFGLRGMGWMPHEAFRAS